MDKMSRIGRPDMNAKLEESVRESSRSWSSCDYEGMLEADGSPLPENATLANGGDRRSPQPAGISQFTAVGSSSPQYPDDAGELSLSRDFDGAAAAAASVNKATAGEGCSLFVPDLVFSLDKDDERPAMPDLPVSQFPAGTPVWVVDVSHVMMQLGDAWDHHLREVSNGNAKGTVIRKISDDLLFVNFGANAHGVEQCFTVPRRCLSTHFIEPYSVPADDGGAVSFGGLGGLKPRAGRAKERTKEKDDTPVLQQYCELVDATTPSKSTEVAWSLFLKGDFKECIAELNAILNDSKGRVDAKLSNEVLTWRSIAYFFNREYDKSLADALKTIENDPMWVRGYVRAARAYTGLGKISRAIDMMTQADRLLPNSTEARDTLAMLQYLKRAQAKVDVYGLQYFLDTHYAKRLMARRAFNKHDAILEDDAILVGCPSLENQGACCEVCLSPTSALVHMGVGNAGSTRNSSSPTSSGRLMRLCSSRCEAVGRNFLSIEAGVGSKGCDFAIQLMLNKATNSADVLSIERAHPAIRLFYLAHYRHSKHVAAAAAASSPSPSPNRKAALSVSVKDVLAAIGVFPLPSLELESKTRFDLEALYSVISSHLSAAEKKIYDKDLLLAAYNYVAHYALPINGVDSQGRPISGNIIAAIASSIERYDSALAASCSASPSPLSPSESPINCEVRLVGPGKVAIVALRDIAAGERLTMAAPKKGRF